MSVAVVSRAVGCVFNLVEHVRLIVAKNGRFNGASSAISTDLQICCKSLACA